MKRATGLLVAVVLCLSTVPLAAREPEQKQFPQLSSKIGGAPDRLPPIEYMTDTLPNGLRVVYLPLRQAPVVHVRVMYHVGSKDERADRQGFAHMFEHMMFRGSAHVAPEQHMKLINMVGGISNAFTSFDQTTYVNTVPSEHTEMALWLEADRMASFKVSDAIFQTERKVVAEEWRMRMNQPFGNLFEEYVKRLFTQHSYRWTPIGNMEQLAQSKTAELQDFFNTYYVPNNAILLVSGDIDVAKTKEWVGRYFAWIPKGEKPPRLAPKEPEQTEGRSATVPASVPLSAVVVGARISGWTNDDQYALALLGEILGGGPSSRLYRRLVASDNPLAAQAQSLHQPLEDGGFFGAMGITLRGKNPADVEKALREEIALLIEKGVTADELAKAKTQYRQGVIQQRKTAEQIARNVGEEWMFGGDPARANTELEKVAAMTADDLKKAAATYLSPNRLTVMQMVPDPTGQLARKAMAQAANTAQAPVVPSTDPVKARVFEFPKDYPTKPPIREAVTAAKFAKGTSFDVPVAGGKAQVIVIPDNRLPLASAVVALRRGSHNEPADKTGLGSLTSEMVRRGAGGMTFEQLNTRLDSLGISIDVDDEGDYTELTATAPADQLAEAVRLSGLVLTKPNFDEKEFANLKQQAQSNLTASLASPTTVAERELGAMLYGDTPLGRKTTPQSLNAITLADVKEYFGKIYRPADAIVILSGDVTPEAGKKLAEQLLGGWGDAKADLALAPVPKYELPPAAEKRKIVLIDHPDAKQAAVRTGVRAFTVQSEQRYAGSLANQILSGGIESRVMASVRAAKGLAYAAHGIFSPGRQAGAFVGDTDTKIEAADQAIEAMFQVFEDMATGKAPVTAEELKEARLRVAGSLVMSMQTVDRQAARRLTALLNGFPEDYWDTYPSMLSTVTAEQVQQVMKQHVDTNKMSIVVVAPAKDVKAKLEKLGPVEVKPMPAAGAEKPEMLK